MTHSPPEDPRTLIDALLLDQQQLTTASRFARRHEDGVPAQARYYRDLIPLTQPKPGQQYAFEVDLDKCSGCKACVSACHSLNGLDEGETWRDIGLLFGDDWRQPFQQTITTACHHCVDPGCLTGCPVLAYDKDPLTGIVRHLDDQCIGCQYCVMKCPYDVPKYSVKRGIVRKCDMCSSRLAVGEAPACAQACPSAAIRITIVDRMEVATRLADGEFLPAAPDPRITLPTTRYKSAKPLPTGLLAGDHAQATPAEAHLPLVFMLVLTQLAVGASVGALFVEPARWLAFIAFATGALGLGLATLHLGQPLKAWRAFAGWRQSWFSREVIVFSGFMLFAALAAVAVWVDGGKVWRWPLQIATAAAGLLGVACSAMIYADTHREFWRAAQSFGKFLGSTVLLGSAITLLVEVIVRASTGSVVLMSTILVAVSAAKLAFEQRIFRQLVDEETPAPTPLNKTARLLAGRLGFAARTRVACGVLGGLVCPALLCVSGNLESRTGIKLVVAALLLCLAGELLERYLFFTAVAPLKMPGAVAA